MLQGVRGQGRYWMLSKRMSNLKYEGSLMLGRTVNAEKIKAVRQAHQPIWPA